MSAYVRKEELAEGIVLYQGDCLEVLPTLGRFDAVVTDPPYGLAGAETDKNEYASFADVPDEVERLVRSIIDCGQYSRLVMTPGQRMMFRYPEPTAVGVFYYPAGTGSCSWGFVGWQPIFYYGKDPVLADGRGRASNSFYATDSAEKNGHPCPKPIGQWTKLLERSTRRGENILDPFMGSGTTGVAAVKLGRKFTGIEIDPGYFDIACRRIAAALKEPDFFHHVPAPFLSRRHCCDRPHPPFRRLALHPHLALRRQRHSRCKRCGGSGLAHSAVCRVDRRNCNGGDGAMSDSVAHDQIQAFFQRWQRLEEEKANISGDLKELFGEAKANGFDTKVLRVVFRDKVADQNAKSEFEAVYDLYWSALGTPRATGAHPARDTYPRASRNGVDGTSEGQGATGAGTEGANPSTGATNELDDDEYAPSGELIVIPEPDADSIEHSSRAKAAHAVSREEDADERQHSSNSGMAGADEPGRQTSASADADPAPIPDMGNPISTEPATIPTAVPLTAEVAVAGDGDSTDSSPAAVPGATNVTPFRTHNPATHFLNSKGLQRLHGCLNAEMCAGSRSKLCFTCSTQHEGPAHVGGAA